MANNDLPYCAQCDAPFSPEESGYDDVCCEDCHTEYVAETNDEETPDEPSEDDITTTDHQTFYQYGRLIFERHTDRISGCVSDDWYYHARNSAGLWEWFHLGRFGDDSNAAIRTYCEKEQFWPDVWWVSDHGNAHRIEL